MSKQNSQTAKTTFLSEVKNIKKEFIRRNLKYIVYAYIFIIAFWLIHLISLSYIHKNNVDYHKSFSSLYYTDIG